MARGWRGRKSKIWRQVDGPQRRGDPYAPDGALRMKVRRCRADSFLLSVSHTKWEPKTRRKRQCVSAERSRIFGRGWEGGQSDVLNPGLENREGEPAEIRRGN